MIKLLEDTPSLIRIDVPKQYSELYPCEVRGDSVDFFVWTLKHNQ